MSINAFLIAICVCCTAHGQELFNIDKEMCCSANIIPKPADQDQQLMPMCCGDKSINVREELCCNNKTIKLPAEALATTVTPMIPLPIAIPIGSFAPYLSFPHYSCCGDTYFNFDTDLCCDGKVVRKPTADNADPTMPPYWMCCGSQLAKIGSQDCCRGKIVDKTSATESCCGDKLIDNNKQICCLDNFLDENEDPALLPRESADVGCCGRNTIDYKKEICCMNKVIPLPAANPDQSGIPVCCGDNLWISGPDEMCCDNKVIKQSGSISCCDTQTYSYDTHVCCDGSVQPRTTNSTFCCGKTTYDEQKEEACCYNSGKVVPIVDNEKRYCCE